MRAETGLGDNSFTPAGNTQEGFLPELHARCDELPHGRSATRVLAVCAFFASLFVHTCVIAGSVLLFRIFPPTVLPVGESIEVTLVALHIPASSSASSGAQADTLPTAMPPSFLRKESVPTGVQPRKHDRAIRQTREQSFEETNNFDSGKDAQPAGNGQAAAGGGAGHGGAGNGSLPVPFGAHINPRPAYPELARQRGQEGQVVLLVNVDVRGNPTKVLVEASSEYALLDQAAIKAIQRWRFNPASRNGEAVPGTVRVPVTFRLQ